MTKHKALIGLEDFKVTGNSFAKLPDNYKLKWLLNIFNNMLIVKDYRESECLLAEASDKGMQFVIFRPAFLIMRQPIDCIVIALTLLGLMIKYCP